MLAAPFAPGDGFAGLHASDIAGRRRQRCSGAAGACADRRPLWGRSGSHSCRRMLLGRNHYHLLLADGVLPDGTGMQLADEARRRGIPVIIMTSYGFRFSQTEFAGFDLLLKPARPA